MTCPRYRFVVLAGRRFMFLADALIPSIDADVRSVDAHAGGQGDDRALVVDRHGREWRAHFHEAEEDPDIAPGDLLGFVVEGSGEAARLSFADGSTSLRQVAAVVREDDRVSVWKPPLDFPEVFTPRPYPWAR